MSEEQQELPIKQYPKGIKVSEITGETPRVDGVFVVREFVEKESPKGIYYIIKLADSTGEIDARCWEVSHVKGKTPEEGELVLVRFDPTIYKKKLQLTVVAIKVLAIAEVSDINEFIPSSPRLIDEMMVELYDNLQLIENRELYGALRALIEEPEVAAKLPRCPAAVKNHHAFTGGLLHHLLSMMECAKFFAAKYSLNRDVMIAACLLHDIGKIWEIEVTLTFEYTAKGTLLGHIPMGLMLQEKIFSQFSVPPELDMHIKHLILSHHGKKEYGAPVEPATLEALVFHLIDMVDSQYQMYQDHVAKAKQNRHGCTDYNRTFGAYFWIPPTSPTS